MTLEFLKTLTSDSAVCPGVGLLKRGDLLKLKSKDNVEMSNNGNKEN
jgi:hypothetical protein